MNELLTAVSASAQVSQHDHMTEGLTAGELRSRARGSGMEFEEMRLYQDGDDIRSIDWRASARLGRPYTRRFSEERTRTRLLVVDQRVGMFFGSAATFKSVHAARVAAQAAWSALARGERVGGLVFHDAIDTIQAGRSRRTVVQLLDRIVRANHSLHAQTPAGIPLSTVIEACITRAERHIDVTIISDFSDYHADHAPLLSALSRRRKLALLRITDPLELSMSVRGQVGVSDGRQRHRVEVDKAARQRYLSELACRRERLHSDALLFGASLQELST